jgi:hypothetical protein
MPNYEWYYPIILEQREVEFYPQGEGFIMDCTKLLRSPETVYATATITCCAMLPLLF